MAFEMKTAKDLPAGAEVETFWSVITKQSHDEWTNRMGDPFTDAEVDAVLANGGMLTRVPTGTAKGGDRG